MRIAVTAASAAMALACFLAPAHAGEVSLKADAIQQLFPGYYQAEVYGGYTLLIHAKSGGKLEGKAFGREDKGKWTIVGDRLCVSWKSWTKGQSKCGDIVRAGDWFIARNQKEGQLLRFTAVASDKFEQQVASASGLDRN